MFYFRRIFLMQVMSSENIRELPILLAEPIDDSELENREFVLLGDEIQRTPIHRVSFPLKHLQFARKRSDQIMKRTPLRCFMNIISCYTDK